MVNHGRSRGCVTCKQRRVKCDEARPKCRPCQRLRLSCEYKTKYAFKDQSHKFCIKNGRAQDPLLALRSLDEPDTAVPFFLDYYASMGRDIQSARGFFETLIPVYCTQQQNLALSLAVSALASEILSIWRDGLDNSQLPRETYTQAVMHLRSAIQDPIERSKPATMLAVLSLQAYENIAAIYGLCSATRIHLDGAVSLLPFADLDHMNLASAYMRRFIFHTEISSAMRQNRPLQRAVYSWIESKDSIAAPDNPSSKLDVIGAFVAELQAKFMQELTQTSSVPPSKRLLRGWRADAKRIDDQLLAWAQRVPDYWQPVRLISGQDIDPSIPTYQSICEVYPSCQIASIWNLWRVQRLLLCKISLNIILYISQSELKKDQTPAENQDFVKCKQIIQELVDSVCYSVPFYLGNRTKSSSMSDFTDPAILLPSHHLLGLEGNKRPLNKQNPSHDPRIPKEDHKRHILSQGPWHAMSPVSRLLTFFIEDDGQLMDMSTLIRPGQHDWIREQFLRITKLLRIPPTEPGGNEGCHPLKPPSQGGVDSDTRVENLARRVRTGAIFMSGP